VVITAPHGHNNDSLQLLAASVREQLGVAALVIAPDPAAAGPAGLTFEQQLTLTQHTDHELTFSLPSGATAAACLMWHWTRAAVC
jgi:hypothetical protein